MNNNIEVIGIDHGWSQMKTSNTCFNTSIKELANAPAFHDNVLEYDDRYFAVGEERLEVLDSKVENENFYLLTLVAMAKELEMEETDADFGMEEKEFIAQYAFRTGDTDLVKKLIEELQEKDADREKVQTKYMQLADNKPEWAEQIENLVIALEMYRIEEDKAVKRITDFLTAHGIDISESVVKDSDVSDIKNMISEAKEEPLKEQEVIPTEKEPTL